MLLDLLVISFLSVCPVLGKMMTLDYARYPIKRNTDGTGQTNNSNNETDVKLNGLLHIDIKDVYQTVNLTVDNGLGDNSRNITAVLDTTSHISQFLGVSNNVTACQAYVDQLDTNAHDYSSIAARVLSTCKKMGVVNVDRVEGFISNSYPVPPSFSFSDDNITYYEGSWVNGLVTVNKGDAQYQYALANVSNGTNVLGIGLADSVLDLYPNSTNLGANGSYLTTYPGTTPFYLYTGYSLFMNSLNNNSGELVYGAFDKAKYTGKLQTLPIMSKNDELYNGDRPLSLVVGGLGFYGVNGKYTPLLSNSFPSTLDMNDRYMRFPSGMVKSVATSLNATWNEQLEHYILNCPTQKQGRASLGFDFGGFVIYVPLHNMIIPAGSRCALAIQPHDKMQYILGQPFMSSSYFVVDLLNQYVSIAQANYLGASKSKIKAFEPSALAPSPLTLDALPTGFVVNSTRTIKKFKNPWTATKYSFPTVSPVNISVMASSSLLAKRESFFGMNSTSNSTTNGSSSKSHNGGASLSGFPIVI